MKKRKTLLGTEEGYHYLLFTRIQLYEDYSYFYEELFRLGEKKLQSSPSVREIGMRSNKIKKAYSIVHSINSLLEEKGSKERFTMIDFLCWVSLNFIFDLLILTREICDKFDLESSINNMYDKFTEDFKNLLRIADSKPDVVFHIFETSGFMNSKEEMVLMTNLWMKKVAEEKTAQKT